MGLRYVTEKLFDYCPGGNEGTFVNVRLNVIVRSAGLNYKDATKTFLCVRVPAYIMLNALSTTIATNGNIVCINGNGCITLYAVLSPDKYFSVIVWGV